MVVATKLQKPPDRQNVSVTLGKFGDEYTAVVNNLNYYTTINSCKVKLFLLTKAYLFSWENTVEIVYPLVYLYSDLYYLFIELSHNYQYGNIIKST